MEFSLLLPLVNFKLIFSKQQKVVSWRFDVTTNDLPALKEQLIQITFENPDLSQVSKYSDS